jgi:GT2 family glycosyltransferase
LKPDWDPLLSQQQNICGQSFFLRAPLQNVSIEQQHAFLTEGKVNPCLFDEADRTRIKAIRRILLTTKRLSATKPARLDPVVRADATAAIIIPTKDHAAFLKRAIDSIHLHRGRSKLRLVIVDNGSTDDAAKKLLRDVEANMDAKVIAYPDAFNFSAMCNAGAAAAKSDVLIFLNNDTEVLSEDWLDRLTGWALQQNIGAVGAKLTYPNGNIQHIGVALGMGGSAGHFGSLIDQNAPSWANRSLCVHEVSAVTGACLAIDRLKFEAVGGFDAENFPVELSDIDICLRLAERGWSAIVDPNVHLMHEESGTRGGATFRRLSVYQDQRTRFIERWRHILRDDPHFHPGLSLFHWRETLG